MAASSTTNTDIDRVHNRHRGIPVAMRTRISPTTMIVRAGVKRIMPIRIITPRIIITRIIPRVRRIVPVGLIPPGVQICRRITAMHINIVVIVMINNLRLFITAIVVLIPIFLFFIIGNIFGIVLIIVHIRLHARTPNLSITTCERYHKYQAEPNYESFFLFTLHDNCLLSHIC
jgi:hypothetical protein